MSRLLGLRRRATTVAVDHHAPPLVAVGVSVRRGRADVVKDVTLDVAAGEIVALVGPNGAGKSSLLAAYAGDLRTSSGQVSVCGAHVEAWSPAALGRRRAVLLQHNDLSFPFSVDTVVRMGRAPWIGRPEAQDDDAVVDRAFSDTDVTHLRARPFTELSGGERARVSLARVIAQRTRVLLLDEPTAALDLQHQEMVLRLARARADDGVAVAVVLHDLGLAAAYADRVAVLDRGELVAVGSPSAVMTPKLLSRVYRQAVDVFPHPRTGAPVVVAAR